MKIFIWSLLYYSHLHCQHFGSLIGVPLLPGRHLSLGLFCAGRNVTVEHAPCLQTAGAGLDVCDTAQDVMRRMGIFDCIRG